MKVTRYTATVVFPLLVASIILADKIIPLAYGAKWSPSIHRF